MTTRSTNATAKPITGEASAGRATFCQSPVHTTPFVPDWTSAAPTRPPMRACVELDGSPPHHVRRFQAIAPKSAARTVWSVARPVSISPFPTVDATAVVTNAPARLAAADTSTAARGDSARVPTHVAT
jgi:hypothetical protein